MNIVSILDMPARAERLAEADFDVVAAGPRFPVRKRRVWRRSRRPELEEIIDRGEPDSDRVAQGPTRITTNASGRGSIATG